VRWRPVPPVPPENGPETLRDLRAALPPAFDPDADCCALLLDAGDARFVPDRDAAGDWLVFLRALGLARERDGHFARTRAPVEADALAEAFVANVYGAREVGDALREGPSDATAVAERVDARVGDRERVERLLDWAVQFGLAARDGEQYIRSRSA